MYTFKKTDVTIHAIIRYSMIIDNMEMLGGMGVWSDILLTIEKIKNRK